MEGQDFVERFVQVNRPAARRVRHDELGEPMIAKFLEAPSKITFAPASLSIRRIRRFASGVEVEEERSRRLADAVLHKEWHAGCRQKSCDASLPGFSSKRRPAKYLPKIAAQDELLAGRRLRVDDLHLRKITSETRSPCELMTCRRFALVRRIRAKFGRPSGSVCD